MHFCFKVRSLGRKVPVALPLLILSALLFSQTVGCEASGPQTDDANTTQEKLLTIIDPPQGDVGIATGAERILRVRYTDTNLIPIPGALIQFAIFGDPRGSTLSSDAGLTNANGEAEVRLRSGAAACRFHINVSASEVTEDVVFYIEVSDAGFGEVAVHNRYDGPQPEAVMVWTQYNLYGDIQCHAIDPGSPPPPLRERVVSGIDQAVHFGALPLNLDHSLLVYALDAEFYPISSGCINIPSSILKVDQRLNMTLWLRDLPLKTVGDYLLTTHISLANTATLETHPLHELLLPWSNLTDCELDPVQLMLDCIIDAVEAGSAADCVVDSLSPLVLSLQAPRGKLSGGCRSAETSQGAESLEEQLSSSMDKEGHDVLDALVEVPAKARVALNSFIMGSTLQILDESSGGNSTLTHRLDAIVFTHEAEIASFEASAAGIAKPIASPILGKVAQTDLGIDEHRFSLPLLQVARLAMGKLLLEPRSIPATSLPLAQYLFDLITFQQGSTTLHGCAAIEHLMCKAAQLPEDCLGDACPHGLAALAHQLDPPSLASAPGSSIILSGKVMLLDTNRDLKADRLGDEDSPGRWQTKITVGPKVFSPYSATFTGTRQ